ncbi:MAG TPA: DUF4260 domain-containing protein [Rubellimicrobium sp.]|nr:DUF4260 domain-containing protein [Rubellimicrobium sp.]
MTGNGTVLGAPNLILRAEGLAVLVASVWVYAALGSGWWLLAVLILAPDLSMLGYLAGARVGAALYNAAHTYVVPLALLALGQSGAVPLGTALGLIWAAHIGMDRVLGYGLKYPWGFKATHLSAAEPR